MAPRGRSDGTDARPITSSRALQPEADSRKNVSAREARWWVGAAWRGSWRGGGWGGVGGAGGGGVPEPVRTLPPGGGERARAGAGGRRRRPRRLGGERAARDRGQEDLTPARRL